MNKLKYLKDGDELIKKIYKERKKECIRNEMWSYNWERVILHGVLTYPFMERVNNLLIRSKTRQ